MANELQQLTVNAAGDDWVDASPGEDIETSYQAQNINIQARNLGLDLSSFYISGSYVIAEISGPIDVDGILFSIKKSISLSLSDGLNYIQIIPGSADTEKSLQLTSSTPVWDSEKNAFYNGDYRVLNWVIVTTSGTSNLFYLIPGNDSNLGILGKLFINGSVIGPLTIIENDVQVEKNVVLTGYLQPTTTIVSGTESLAAAEYFTLPRGIITIETTNSQSLIVEKYINGAWSTYKSITQYRTTQVVSNGEDTRVYNDGDAVDIYYRIQ